MHITLTVNYDDGAEYELDTESDDFAGVQAAVEAQIANIGRPNYSSLVIVLVPKN